MIFGRNSPHLSFIQHSSGSSVLNYVYKLPVHCDAQQLKKTVADHWYYTTFWQKNCTLYFSSFFINYALI